jgi:hypothetical protein
MMTFSTCDVADRRAFRLVSRLAVLAAAILPVSAHGGLVDACGVEGTVAAGRSGAKRFSGSDFDSCRSGEISCSSNPLAAIIAEVSAPSGLVSQALPEQAGGWQAELRAAGYTADPAFREDWRQVAPTDGESFAQGGSNASSAMRGQDGVGYGLELGNGSDPNAMPNWLRQGRQGIRTAAFTFYLSPSIPGVSHGVAY